MRTSPTIAALAPALAKAAGELPDPGRDGKGNYGAYVRLSDLLPDVRRVLSAHGLVVLQSCELDTMSTTILHSSGEWVATDYPLARDGNPQKQGSAVTYARRYSLMAALGLTGVDDDDDGQAASTATATKAREKAQRSKAHDPTWAAARAGFCAALVGVTYDEVAAWCEAHGRPRPSHQTPDQRAKLSAYLATDDGRVRVAEWAATQGGGE